MMTAAPIPASYFHDIESGRDAERVRLLGAPGALARPQQQVGDLAGLGRRTIGRSSGHHIPTGSQIRLTDNDVNDDYPRMSGSRVAWTSWETDTDSEVFLASFSLPFTDVGSEPRLPQRHRESLRPRDHERLQRHDLRRRRPAAAAAVRQDDRAGHRRRLSTRRTCAASWTWKCPDRNRCTPDNYVESAAREGSRAAVVHTVLPV